MPHIHSNRRKPAAAALMLVFAVLALAACGSSSNGSKSSATTSASASSTGQTGPGGTGSTGPGGSRFGAIRECLQKNGITLPKRGPRTGRPPGAGGLLGGGAGPVLPKGVTRAQYEAALKKCGGGVLGRGRLFNNPARVQAFQAFAACMRQNGVPLPAPNTSGKGPIFDTKGLDTTSATFKAAVGKCQSHLQGLFRARPLTLGGRREGV